MSIRFGAILILFVAGCSAGVPAGVQPSTPEERAIAKHVRETAAEPESVVFAKWGPHLAGIGYRATYRSKVQGSAAYQDWLFEVAQGKVTSGHPNVFGEQWIEIRKQHEQPTANGGPTIAVEQNKIKP